MRRVSAPQGSCSMCRVCGGLRTRRRPRVSQGHGRPRAARGCGCGAQRRAARHRAARDFSTLAPTIPQLVAERCVGCMACVSACPDAAILGIAVPEADAGGAHRAFAGTQDDPVGAAASARSHFVHTQKYAEVPAKRAACRPPPSASSSTRPLQGLRGVRRGVRGPGS